MAARSPDYQNLNRNGGTHANAGAFTTHNVQAVFGVASCTITAHTPVKSGEAIAFTAGAITVHDGAWFPMPISSSVTITGTAYLAKE